MHTKGPWTWFNYPDGRKLLSGEDRAVLHCPDGPMGCEPTDARLIAAAPDLLAAVKEYLEWGAMTGSDRDLFEDKFRAAIKKAEGAQ